MKKLLFLILSILLSSNFIYAGNKKSDTNKTMTDDEFMKQFMVLEQKEKNAKAKTIKTEEELEASKKLGKTLDEVGNLIDMKYKGQK